MRSRKPRVGAEGRFSEDTRTLFSKEAIIIIIPCCIIRLPQCGPSNGVPTRIAIVVSRKITVDGRTVTRNDQVRFAGCGDAVEAGFHDR